MPSIKKDYKRPWYVVRWKDLEQQVDYIQVAINAAGGIAAVVDDPSPQLGGDLDLNGFDITGTGSVIVNRDVRASGQIAAGTGANEFDAGTVEINWRSGNTQSLDGSTLLLGPGSMTFIGQLEGASYALVYDAGPTPQNFTLPTGYWMNGAAFDFSTLAADQRAMITFTYVDSEWYYAVKELVLVP